MCSYVKNMDKGLWYKFNDSSVTPANPDDVKTTYGGSSGTTAYMLMYR